MIKELLIDGIDAPVVIAKRKGTRSIRITLRNDGLVRVSVPYGVPEIVAKQYVISKKDWISKHIKPADILVHGQHIGKNHQLIITRSDSTRINSKVTSTEIRVSLPMDASVSSPSIQKKLHNICEKALIKESEILLVQRLEYLSKKFSINYRSVQIKKLKSRWGSCDNKNNIALNCYLIQLDWNLIDYVLCHELTHTIHHHHQASFWDYLGDIYPEYKWAKKELKNKPTSVFIS
ncbi:M48 family metallopeptidase [Candidatus Saccharibacteria bacterium]|nr:M48 family metallopeptidase [Candidatus Saccharibacteria bacterium]